MLGGACHGGRVSAICAVPEARLARRGGARLASLAMMVAAAMVAGQVYLVAANGFQNLVETPFLAYSLAGSFAIHLSTRPGRAEWSVAVALALSAATVFVFGSGRFRGDWPTCIACAGFLGLGSLVVLGGQVCRLRGPEQHRKLRTLAAGSVIGFSALFIAVLLNWTTRMHPRTYDLYLYVADAGYQLPVSRWTGQLMEAHQSLMWACELAYQSLPLVVSLLYAYERSGSRKLPLQVLPTLLGGGVAV